MTHAGVLRRPDSAAVPSAGSDLQSLVRARRQRGESSAAESCPPLDRAGLGHLHRCGRSREGGAEEQAPPGPWGCPPAGQAAPREACGVPAAILSLRALRLAADPGRGGRGPPQGRGPRGVGPGPPSSGSGLLTRLAGSCGLSSGLGRGAWCGAGLCLVVCQPRDTVSPVLAGGVVHFVSSLECLVTPCAGSPVVTQPRVAVPFAASPWWDTGRAPVLRRVLRPQRCVWQRAEPP